MSREHRNFLTPRDESLADDLNKERGDVRGSLRIIIFTMYKSKKVKNFSTGGKN
jgi:hypothetical protein